MARRRESFFDSLIVSPWWVAAGFGLLGYAGIAFLFPRIVTGPLQVAVAKAVPTIGLVWLGLCAVAACGSALRSFLIPRKFDRQRGLDDIRALSWRQFESIVGEAFRQLQKYLRESVRVLAAATDHVGSASKAAFWFRNQPLSEFDYKTPEVLVSEGRADDVLRYIDMLSAGSAG